MGRKTVRYVGEKIGSLEVLSILPQSSSGRHVKVEVLCHLCGTTSIKSSVIFIKATSCGCQKGDTNIWKNKGPKTRPWQLPEGEAAKRLLIKRYRGSAKRRGIYFELSDEQLSTLFKSPCHYCGQSETNTSKGLGKTSGDYSYVGVDRVDPREGYTTSNTVSCCWLCNMMKNTLTQESFLSHIDKIHKHSLRGM